MLDRAPTSTSRLPRLAGAIVLAGALLAGCGSSSGGSGNGVASKSADQILSAAQSATNSATSVHVAGSTTSNGTSESLDLTMSAGHGATGTVAEGGLSVQIITTGNEIFLKGTPQFWTKFGGAAAAQLLAGKWLKAPASDPNFASIGQLANFHNLVGSALTQHGKLTKGGTSTIHGQEAVAVKDTTQGGTLYVATHGPAYPVQIAKSGGGGGSLTFDRWNQPVNAAAPAGAIDVSQLKGAK